MISSRFVGREKEGKEQFGTFGKFYSVEYALIKIQGVVNPSNLGNYLADKEVLKRYSEAESKLFDCLWNGTNALVSRSKYPQRSIFFLEVSYDGAIYNDLPVLVEETDLLRGKISSLPENPLNFDRLVDALAARKRVLKVRVASCRELLTDASNLITKMKEKQIPAEVIPVEEPKL
jgi:hypothetical protein